MLLDLLRGRFRGLHPRFKTSCVRSCRQYTLQFQAAQDFPPSDEQQSRRFHEAPVTQVSDILQNFFSVGLAPVRRWTAEILKQPFDLLCESLVKNPVADRAELLVHFLAARLIQWRLAERLEDGCKLPVQLDHSPIVRYSSPRCRWRPAQSRQSTSQLR